MPRKSLKSAGSSTTQTDKSGVLLSDKSIQSLGAYIHAESDDWSISSNVALTAADFFSHELLCVPLPGRLGCYVLPVDAVFSLKAVNATTYKDFERCMNQERTLQQQNIANVHTLSVTVDAVCDDSLIENEMEEASEHGSVAESDEEDQDGDEDMHTQLEDDDDDVEQNDVDAIEEEEEPVEEQPFQDGL